MTWWYVYLYIYLYVYPVNLFCLILFVLLLYIYLGISASSIVGIDWRLDYSVRSKHAGQDNTPLFFLSLKIRDINHLKQQNGPIRTVELLATQDELQDLLAKVRDAVKQVDRVLAAASATNA